MSDSKILITNFPRFIQRFSIEQINDNNKFDVVYGYDFNVDQRIITLNIARDLITSLLTFEKVYIEADHIWDILQVWGIEYIKELLRLHILCIIPDQELCPVIIRDRNGLWNPDFLTYVIGNENDISQQDIHKWSHVEHQFRMHGINSTDANAILYLLEENAADIGSIKDLQQTIKRETSKDCISTTFLSDSNFCRRGSNGKFEYNIASIIRLLELNKSAVLSSALNIDNVKMDAEISNIMFKKTTSVFAPQLHTGTDALIKIEQQKGFPDLGELFINKIINLDDLLKLRNSFNGKIFRYWAKTTNYEENAIRQEVMNSVQKVLGSKCLQPIRMLACNLLGIIGFLPGLAASALDSYVLEKIMNGWHPNFFLDNDLKKMIDVCVERNNTQNKELLRKKMFKGVGRNDLCPCGSGKKFKNCHGKELD